jgi:hypothetical protein
MEATSTSVAIPEVPGFPTFSAPLGLGTVALPADAHAIAILFAHLPAEVAGQSRAPLPDRSVDELIVAYGPDPGTGPSLSLAAMNLSGDPFDEFPIEPTVAGFLSIAVDPAFDYGAVAFGQDGTLLWVCAEHVLTDASGTSLVRYSLAWGDAASPWLFGASAGSPAGLAALVTVFVETAEGEPWRHETPASGSPGAGSLCRLHEVPFVHGVTDRAASIAYWRGAAS